MTELVSIGWVATDWSGDPVRPVTGNGWQMKRNPPRIYKTEAMALNQGVMATEVFIKKEVLNG